MQVHRLVPRLFWKELWRLILLWRKKKTWMINGGVFSDLNSMEKNNHAHHFHLGLTSRCLTGIYWFFRRNINIVKYMYINGQRRKWVSQKRIRKQSKKRIKTVVNAANKDKFLLSKNYAFKINRWGWSLGDKPFNTLNVRSPNFVKYY